LIFLPYNNNTAYTIIPLEKNSNYQINPEATASWVYRDTDGKIIYIELMKQTEPKRFCGGALLKTKPQGSKVG